MEYHKSKPLFSEFSEIGICSRILACTQNCMQSSKSTSLRHSKDSIETPFFFSFSPFHLLILDTQMCLEILVVEIPHDKRWRERWREITQPMNNMMFVKLTIQTYCVCAFPFNLNHLNNFPNSANNWPASRAYPAASKLMNGMERTKKKMSVNCFAYLSHEMAHFLYLNSTVKLLHSLWISFSIPLFVIQKRTGMNASTTQTFHQKVN